MCQFEHFPSDLTMGAPVGVIIFMEPQSIAKNGTHQKLLHEALFIHDDLLILIMVNNIHFKLMATSFAQNFKVSLSFGISDVFPH